MRIVFMGTPEFSVPILKALNEKYEIVMVVSQPNRERKKGQLLPTPVCACAKELGLNIIQPEKIGLEYEKLQALNADIMVTAAYGQYVPTKILKLFKKCLNVHGSLLPKYRGGAPIQRAIMNGETTTGITIMEMVKALDAGVMYAKASYEILETDNSSKVFKELSLIGRDLLMAKIEDIVSGKLQGEKQDESLATYAPNLSASEELVDFNKSAFLVARQINGLALEPGAVVKLKDFSFKVFEAKAVADHSDFVPGTVLSLKKQVLIKTLDGAVALNKILVPGKKVLDAKDFVNGQKILKEFDVI